MRNRFRRSRRSGATSGASADTVQIVDLPDRHVASYLVCLEDWSDEMREAGDHKARWYEAMQHEGLRVKVAVDLDDRPVGMIQYVPIERSPAVGAGLAMILCIWVHGHREGVGSVQGHGIGEALLGAAEDDAQASGATGMAAWGLHLPVWMRASWFKDHGYRTADRRGARELVWKPFVADARPPAWPYERPVPVGDPSGVDVVAFKSGWCPAANLVYERARRAAEEVGEPVSFTTIDTSDRDVLVGFGRSDAVFVDGRPLQRSAPPSYASIRRRLDRRRRRLLRRRARSRT